MIKIKVASHMNDTDNELKARLDYRLPKLLTNSLYSLLLPQTKKTGELLDIFKAACDAVKDNGGGSVLTGIKNNAKNDLKQYVKFFNSNIEVEANKLGSDEAAEKFALGTGVELQQSKSGIKKTVPLTYLEIPTNFNVVNDELKKGAYSGSWDAVKGTIMYALEELDENGKVKNTVFYNKTFFFIAGTESEVKKTFRLMAIGVDTITSDYTENVSVWVR